MLTNRVPETVSPSQIVFRMTLHSIRNHEQGQRQPSWPAVVKLALALGVSTDVFAICEFEAGSEEESNAKKTGEADR